MPIIKEGRILIVGPTSTARFEVRALTQRLGINKLYELFKSARKVWRPRSRKRAQILQQNAKLLKLYSRSQKEHLRKTTEKKAKRCDEHLKLEAATQANITTRYLNRKYTCKRIGQLKMFSKIKQTCKAIFEGLQHTAAVWYYIFQWHRDKSNWRCTCDKVALINLWH